eukprot:NODE_484_length_7802_cov_0.227184.p6 type:complete len:148 gc:universal NODE_484_length_7802_cov_0.227184:2900-2457(-)
MINSINSDILNIKSVGDIFDSNVALELDKHVRKVDKINTNIDSIKPAKIENMILENFDIPMKQELEIPQQTESDFIKRNQGFLTREDCISKLNEAVELELSQNDCQSPPKKLRKLDSGLMASESKIPSLFALKHKQLDENLDEEIHE